jgi:hypothetical protein
LTPPLSLALLTLLYSSTRTVLDSRRRKTSKSKPGSKLPPKRSASPSSQSNLAESQDQRFSIHSSNPPSLAQPSSIVETPRLFSLLLSVLDSRRFCRPDPEARREGELNNALERWRAARGVRWHRKRCESERCSVYLVSSSSCSSLAFGQPQDRRSPGCCPWPF